MHRERRRRRKHALPVRRSILTQITYRGPRLILVVNDVVQIEAHLHVVLPGPVPRRQIQRRGSLQPLGAPGQILKVTTLRHLRRNFVRRTSVRLIPVANAYVSDPQIEQPAAGKALLIPQGWKPGDRVSFHRALLRNERRNTVIRRVIVVRKQPGGKDVGRGQVVLHLHQIAAANQFVGVGAGRQFRNIKIVVLRLHAVVPPGPVALDGSGKRESRHELVEADSVQFAEGWNEIRRVEAELVVAHAGRESQHASRGAAVLHGIPRSLGVDRAHRIGAHPQAQRAADRRADVESVHRVQRFPRLRARHMHLLCRILHHAGKERQQVADVARSLIGNVDDLRGVHRRPVGNLLVVDPGQRCSHVYLLVHDLFVRQCHLYARLFRFDPARIRRVETRLLHVKLIRIL